MKEKPAIFAISQLMQIPDTAHVTVWAYKDFHNWVHARLDDYQDRNLLSGIVRRLLPNGDYKVVIFLYADERNGGFVEVESFQAKVLDDELEEVFGDDNVIVTLADRYRENLPAAHQNILMPRHLSDAETLLRSLERRGLQLTYRQANFVRNDSERGKIVADLGRTLFWIEEEKVNENRRAKDKQELTWLRESQAAQHYFKNFLSQFFQGQKVYSVFTLNSAKDYSLTPKYLNDVVTRHIKAIAKIQNLTNKLHKLDHREIRISSITQNSPISVTLEGAAEAAEIIKETITPWRREHAQQMAHLQQEEKRAEILAKHINAAKERAEANKLNAETQKQLQETEKIRLENEKLKLELQARKFELAVQILNSIAPGLSEKAQRAHLQTLLRPLDVLLTSELEIQVEEIPSA